MILLLACIIFVGGKMAQTYSGPPETPHIDMKTKPVMCSFKTAFSNSSLCYVGIESFPCECDIILFEDFSIDNKSVITVETEILKQVASLKPTIVIVERENGYADWMTILTPDGYQKDVDVLCKFAQQYKLLGFELESLSVSKDGVNEVYTPGVMQNLPDYLKKLKFSENTIIGLRIDPLPPVIKNPCITDFASLNEVVDFFEIYTIFINQCRADVHNNIIPLKSNGCGREYQLGMEEIVAYVKETAIDYTKAYYSIEIYPVDSSSLDFYFSYVQICYDCKADFEFWCIPTTEDYYDKGKLVKAENCGINILFVQLDDFDNTCGCGSFVGLHNILAGYKGGSVLPCPKFDVKKNP